MTENEKPLRKGGRGQRGGKKNSYGDSTNGKQNNLQKKKKTIDDYFFYVGSSKQASDYKITSEFIINYVKMTFERGNDIGEALQKLELENTDLWKPTLRRSTNDNETEAALENEQIKIEFKSELDEYMKRKRVYEDNQVKAYSLLWARCAKAMQNRLMARLDFETSIYNKPINLLKAIKEHSLNYQETRYEMSKISDAF